MKRPAEISTKQRSIRPRGHNPVIAGRVSEALYQRIKTAAKASGQTMSGQLASLAEMAFEYQRALGDLENWMRQQKANLANIEKGNVAAALRRLNWKRDGTTGHWIPPDIHGLPPNSFISEEEAAAPPAQVATMTPAVEEALSRVVEAAVAKALTRAKLTIGEEK